MRRTIMSGLATLAALAVLAPSARADVATSLTPSCLNSACSLVVFQLEVLESNPSSTTDDWYLFDFNMTANSGTDFVFDESSTGVNSFSVTDADSNPILDATDVGLNFSGTSKRTLDFNGAGLPLQLLSPISITVAFSTSNASDFTSLSYSGDLSQESGDLVPSTGESFGGTVTPEPLSMVLLGTGLAGIAAARRRKNLQQDGEEEV